MQCAFCGYPLVHGTRSCPRCGGQVADTAAAGHVFAGTPFESSEPSAGPASAPTSALGDDVFASAPALGRDLFDGPTSTDPAPGGRAAPPQPPRSRPADDPEAGLHTGLVSIDRQAEIATRLLEAQPGAKTPEAPQPRGLPDSRVARGVEDSLLDIKRLLFRMGRSGRVALWSYLVVIIGCVAPWYYLPYEGFTPGLEVWGWLPLAISVAAIGTLAWRHRLITGARVAPVLLHLVLAAALVLVLLWRYREYQLIAPHLRPDLTIGFYLSAAGALGASMGALIGLKDVR